MSYLTATGKSKYENNHTYLEFKCRCGVMCWKRRGRNPLSCGCHKLEYRPEVGRNGTLPTREYSAWNKMIGRCENPRDKRFSSYGGRGIKICTRWRESFANFYADMGPRPSPRHSLDRIDNDGNYEPGNCRWAENGTQMRNTSRSTLGSLARILLRQTWKRAGKRDRRRIAETFGVKYETAWRISNEKEHGSYLADLVVELNVRLP